MCDKTVEITQYSILRQRKEMRNQTMVSKNFLSFLALQLHDKTNDQALKTILTNTSSVIHGGSETQKRNIIHYPSNTIKLA